MYTPLFSFCENNGVLLFKVFYGIVGKLSVIRLSPQVLPL
jgi:hypothetical protein